MGQPRPLFVLSVLFTPKFSEKTLGLKEDSNSEGEHADHLTTTTANSKNNFTFWFSDDYLRR